MPIDVSNKLFPAPPKPSQADAQNFDRFHPEMPQIPGVNTAADLNPPSGFPKSHARLLRALGTGAAVLVIGIALTWLMKSIPSRATVPDPTKEAVALGESSLPDYKPSALAGKGPTVAASAKELAKTWAAKQFLFTKPTTHEQVKAMIIRLPSGGLWAFALQDPYGRCDLELVTDLKRLAAQYGYRASHPMVVNPCNNTIYDPLKISSNGSVWIRGDVVQGGGLRPPLSINVQAHGSSIIADRME